MRSKVSSAVLAAALLLAAPALTGAFDLPALKVVLEPQVVGADIPQFHFLSLVPEDDQVAAYFIDHRQCLFQVGRAVSVDGQVFDDPAVVLSRDPQGVDAAKASFPGVLKVEGVYHLVYEARTCANRGTIAYATSEDGLDFTKHGDILWPSGLGAESLEVGTPSLFYEDGQFILYYHGHDGEVVRILAAEGPDLFNLTRLGVILDVDAWAWDRGTVGKRSQILHLGDYYYMFYEGCTSNMGDQGRWGIGLARASSPTGPWEKYDHNPILANHRWGFGVDGPAAYLGPDGAAYLYFRVADNQTGRARVSGLAAAAENEGDFAPPLAKYRRQSLYFPPPKRHAENVRSGLGLDPAASLRRARGGFGPDLSASP